MGCGDEDISRDLLPIVLMGLPGSGKTTVGRKLASWFGLPFRDCDEEIVKRIKISIPEYFARHGEAGFREKEAAVIADLKEFPGVFSLGGGALTQLVNRRVLVGKTLVYLQSSVATIVRRIGADSGRPLLDGAENLQAKLELLAAQREVVFEDLARIRVQVDDLTIPQIVAEIVSELKSIQMGR